MSKVIYIALRQKNNDPKKYFTDLKRTAEIICPDNITPNPTNCFFNDGMIGCVVNPVDSVKIQNYGICLGIMTPETKTWYVPGEEVPNGSFALFRSNERFVEVITDFQATRTIWYSKTAEMFIASSSQRAIIMLLKSFQIDNSAVAWMLSSGTLGPNFSWDKRIKCLNPNSKLLLNRDTWSNQLSEGKIFFELKTEHLSVFKKQYTEALNHNFSTMDIDLSKSFLPLTGGKDSRLILETLRNQNKNIYCATWGLGESLKMDGSDASIASKLAKHFELDWDYYQTDYDGREKAATILSRFLCCSEGRLDNIEAFSDGLDVWKRLFSKGMEVSIGGSHAFGHKKSENNAFHIRKRKRATILHDFNNLPQYVCEYYKQTLPDYLLKNKKESYIQYIHRVHQQFFNPFADSVLNESKSCYLEVINPMLSYNLVSIMRSMPDKFTKEKIFILELVQSIAPEIGFNTTLSVRKTISTMKDDRFHSEIKNVLKYNLDSEFFPKNFLRDILSAIDQHGISVDQYTGKDKNLINFILSVAPLSLRNKIKSAFIKKIKADLNIVAFRAYIIIKMAEILKMDSKVLKN